MMRRLLLTALPLVVLLCTLLMPATSLAYDTYQGINCSGKRASSAVCVEKAGGSSTDPIAGNGGLLMGITNIVSFIAGAAAIILLIVGAIKYATSGGDSNNITSAKRTVVSALVGLAFVILARTLVVFVASKL